METPPLAPAPEEPKKSNTLLIMIVVAVMLLCCCCIAVALAWQYGDQVIQGLGL
jgi:hypothetical protein